MRSMIIAAIVVAASGVLPAQAAPTFQVSIKADSLGNAWIINDVPGSIINVKSSSGILIAPTFPNGPIPAPAIVDEGDLPFYLAFLNTPAGVFKLGKVSNASSSLFKDFTMDWYPAFGQPPVQGAVVFLFPEPSGALMASLATIGLVSARRSRRPRRVAS